MLQYHTTFAKIISQCPQQYHIIQITGTFTISWLDDYSASWVHRGNDNHPPTPIELLISNPRGDNKDNCNLSNIHSPSQKSKFMLCIKQQF